MAEAVDEVQNAVATAEADGLYRCDNPTCPLGQGEGTPGFFSGGALVPNEETNEPEFQKGVCPTCHVAGTEIDPATGEDK